MLVIQVVALAAVIGIAIFFSRRAKQRAQRLGDVQPGLDAVRAGFAQTRGDGETEPVCVVAYHYTGASVQQVTIGVTDRRILVVKGTGPMATFDYDEEGEHLPVARKTAEQRGFFEWRHGPFADGSKGYKPVVKAHPPFAGEEWRMYPTLAAYPGQKAALREFARRFYFQWFYD